MATLSYELGKPKQDGTHKVSILLSHKGKRKRLPTNIIVGSKDISRAGNITSRSLQKTIDDTMNEYRNRLYELEIDLLDRDVDVEWICSHLSKQKGTLDFFDFTEGWIEKSTLKGRKNYAIMLNSLERYVGCRTLPFSMIDHSFLEGYKRYLEGHPRAQSLYLGNMRHIFNEAMHEYNTAFKRPLPQSPFENFTVPKDVPQTKDRVVSDECLARIFNYKGTRRIGMARDCYILSFCLMGMNSVDLYECKEYKNGILSYDRAKTKDRRSDNAHIEINVPDIVKPLFDKYKGKTRVFDFYLKYADAPSFNKNINKGLHYIADDLKIPRFDFYSARHTWASIARNKLGIDKYTIHEALNHVSNLDITDLYIQKDYSLINAANSKVIAYLERLLTLYK